MGDFNVVRQERERKGSTFNGRKASDFNEFINSAGLMEVGMGIRKYTWIDREGSKLSKLDRFLISRELLDFWSGLYATILDRCFSDHCTILLKVSNKDFGPILFRFFDWWLKREGFNDLVRSSWGQGGISGSHACVFKAKLKRLKNHIKEWKMSLPDSGETRIKVLQEEMNEWDKKAESTVFSLAENE